MAKLRAEVTADREKAPGASDEARDRLLGAHKRKEQ